MTKFTHILMVFGTLISLCMSGTVNAQDGNFDDLYLDGGSGGNPFVRFDQSGGNHKYIVGFTNDLRFYDGNSYSFKIEESAPGDALVVNDTGTSVKTEVKIENSAGGRYISFDHSATSQTFGVRSLSSNSGLYNGGVGLTTNSNFYPLWVFDTALSETLALRQEGVGIGTYTAQVPLHIKADGSPFTDPKMRLDNNTNAWDVGTSGMGKFHIDDATNAKTVLAINPNSGNLGLGTTDASSPVHVVRDDGTSAIRVDENSAGNNVRTLFSLLCNTCTPGFRFNQVLPGNQTWFFRMLQSGSFSVDDPATIPKEAEFRSGGDLKIGGNLIQASSREIKNNIVDVDTADVLAKLMTYPSTNGPITIIRRMFATWDRWRRTFIRHSD